MNPRRGPCFHLQEPRLRSDERHEDIQVLFYYHGAFRLERRADARGEPVAAGRTAGDQRIQGERPPGPVSPAGRDDPRSAAQPQGAERGAKEMPATPRRSNEDLRKIVAAIGSHLVAQIQSGDDPLDLPTDHRRYTTRPLSVAHGASGIALFLKRTRGEVPAVLLDALARKAPRSGDDHHAPGLYMGSSGIAWTLLELGLRSEAEALMDVAARSPILFEIDDMFHGAAGWGLANLFFFTQLGDERYLRNAADAFDRIKPRLKRGRGGGLFEDTAAAYHGLAHGASGVGYFLLRLYRATGQAEHLEAARALLDHDLASLGGEAHASPARRRSAVEERAPCASWRSGSAGIGAVALRFHAALGEERYLAAARDIARQVERGATSSPTNFSGTAGIGNFFVDLHRRTGEEGYLEEARRLVDRVMRFALKRPPGLAFPGEDLVHVSADYGAGSAGTGMFIHRVIAGGGLPYFDL
ncbi:lanthionine synthetase C family protein [Sorangium sp. So ce131]|uniref:lanthionine synthetase C family protein n=1 Tax=Sorangium sp. So ce131 TaxID=3133282 RepID=UPI003F6187B5